jgi:hypothetical protein
VNNRIVISWQSYLLFSIVSILAVPLALANQLTVDNIPFFCVIGIGVTFATGLITYETISLIKLFTKELSAKEQDLISIGVIAFAGAMRGALLYFAIDLYDLNQPTNFFTKIWTSTTTTLLWLTGISVVMTSRNSFRKEYEALLPRAIVALSLRSRPSVSDSLPPQIEGEFAQIEEILSKAVNVENLPQSKESLLFAAAELKMLIEQKIRPLSHRLWSASISSSPKIKMANSFKASLQYLNLPPLPLTLFLVLATTLNVGTSLSWTRGVFSAFIIVAELLPLLFLYQNRIGFRTAGKVLPNVVFLLLPGTILSATFYLSNRFIFKDDVGALNLIFIPLFIFVAIPISTFQIVNQDRQQLLAQIQESISRIESVSALKTQQINADVASYLHNSLQSQLLAIAGQLEISAQNLDDDEFLKNIDRINATLLNPLRQDFNNFMNDPISRLKKLENAWSGIANVKITIGDEVLKDHNRNILIAQLIEESIANAVRHSKAKSVIVSAKLVQGDRVHLTIQNDGESSPDGTDGIGSAWLDHFAPNSWSRKSTEQATELDVILP